MEHVAPSAAGNGEDDSPDALAGRVTLLIGRPPREYCMITRLLASHARISGVRGREEGEGGLHPSNCPRYSVPLWVIRRSLL